MERRTLEMVRAGDHWSLRMSRQMEPLALMLGWQILVMKLHLGGRKGQSVGKWMLRKKTPPEQGLSSGPTIVACQWNWSLSVGPAEQLAGGSFCRSSSSFWILFCAIKLLQTILAPTKYIVRNGDVIARKSSDANPPYYTQIPTPLQTIPPVRSTPPALRRASAWTPIIFIEIKKNMIKQYDFPRIFQNVVGEVIPPSLRHRDFPPKELLLPSRLEEISSSCNSAGKAPRGGALYVKSKKKKLERRMKFNKTSSCFSGQEAREEDKLSQNGSVLARNFLKRKQLTLQKTEKHSLPLERDEVYEKTATLDEEEDEVRSNLAQAVPSKRNIHMRIRTSFDHNAPEKEKDADTHRPFKQRTSQNNAVHAETHQTLRSKPKHRTFFKYDLISEEKSHSRIDDSRPAERKKSKKKTVNFVVGSEKENEQDVMRTDSPRRGTRVQRTFVQKSSKLNPNSKTPTPNHLSGLELSSGESSHWSARSVVSIKFTSTRNLHSKRTLRSQQSIFDDSSHFMVKQTDSATRYRTRTHIKFPHAQPLSLKNYKSMTSLSEVSIDLRSDWSIAKTRRKQNRHQTNKSIASSKKLVEKKARIQNKVSILVKSNDPYLFSDSLRNLIEPIKSTKFQDLVFKKSNTLFKAARTATDPDIFTELNNFHKFLNDNSVQDSDHDLQRVISRPVVIDSSTGHRQVHSSRLQNEENLMIDMGLTLLKKMSILRQKRL